MPDDAPTPNLSRSAASAWFIAQGYEHVTVDHLAELAARGKGPKGHRVGKYIYYPAEELSRWLSDEIRRCAEPRRRGRLPPKAA